MGFTCFEAWSTHITKTSEIIFNADILLYIGNRTIEENQEIFISFNRIKNKTLFTHTGDSKNMSALQIGIVLSVS